MNSQTENPQVQIWYQVSKYGNVNAVRVSKSNANSVWVEYGSEFRRVSKKSEWYSFFPTKDGAAGELNVILRNTEEAFNSRKDAIKQAHAELESLPETTTPERNQPK